MMFIDISPVFGGVDVPQVFSVRPGNHAGQRPDFTPINRIIRGSHCHGVRIDAIRRFFNKPTWSPIKFDERSRETDRPI
jgi:hypothetical protein